jgi:hypothetical protein
MHYLQEAEQPANELELVGEQGLVELELAKVERACGLTGHAEKELNWRPGKLARKPPF